MWPDENQKSGYYPTGNSGTMISGGVSYPPMVPQVMPLDELQKQLAHAVERVQKATAVARATADNLLGPRPEANGIGDKIGAAQASGRLNSLNDQASHLHRMLADLEIQLERFAGIA